ncbi:MULTISPECIES: LCP family protein [unclassified Serinicoccus]|uniref:LCP family protein n=1 Tax=unclassified Serinicoccus TaxID=2643101 RepID=UPI0038552E9A
MPNHPEDDWTRPIPRTPRDGRRSDPDPTERIPRGGRFDEDRHDQGYAQAPGSGDERYDGRHEERYDERYDQHDGYRDDDAHRDTRPVAGGGAGPGRGGRPPRPPRRRRPRYGVRRVIALLALLLAAYLVVMVVVVAQVWGSINRLDATPEVADRPGAAAGSNYLLVGTDSRENLTEDQQSSVGGGAIEGSRADTVMLLNVPTFGDPTLVSLPRDSYVEIRDGGWNKLNAAHSTGGPQLLVDTVERATGLPIDGYLEIGFGGFVDVVDEVDGVQMCLDEPMQDDRAHIDLPAGCQDLTGEEALGYVRMRYSDPLGDMGRVERQREFLAALTAKMATPGTVLVPWQLHQVGTATGGAIALGEDTSLVEAGQLALAMRSVASGGGNSVTVPVADTNYQTNVGSAVLWDEQGATQLFTALRQGQAITVEP